MTGADEVLLECVPNFSEGRDDLIVAALVGAISSIDGAHVLDSTADHDHNRAVITFAGAPQSVADAAFEAARAAVAFLDLRGHLGVHRRMGALDVLPFVPLGGADMALAVAMAHAVAVRIGTELDVPVFCYGDAALGSERRLLGAVRNLGFERLSTLVGADPTFAPDYGPPRMHPTAGAVAVGARPFLIAFNIELACDDVALARRIARAVRERDGGLDGVQAMGFALDTVGRVQVSTNVVDYQRTSLTTLFDRVAELAAAESVAIERSELIGLAPVAALDEAVAAHVRLDGFDAERQTVERALARVR